MLDDKFKEYKECIADIIENENLLKLSNYEQHINTCRLQHSINVSYNSYLICKSLKLDYKAAARAGILHDFFLYCWKEEKHTPRHHTFAHPVAALKSAKEITQVSPKEENAILAHMWPLCSTAPKYIESFIVSLADKHCAMVEVINGLSLKFKKASVN